MDIDKVTVKTQEKIVWMEGNGGRGHLSAVVRVAEDDLVSVKVFPTSRLDSHAQLGPPATRQTSVTIF